LDQAPQAKGDNQDQRRRERAEPYETTMRPTLQPPSRAATLARSSWAIALWVLSSGI
jgi:hypothetical protein